MTQSLKSLLLSIALACPLAQATSKTTTVTAAQFAAALGALPFPTVSCALSSDYSSTTPSKSITFTLHTTHPDVTVTLQPTDTFAYSEDDSNGGEETAGHGLSMKSVNNGFSYLSLNGLSCAP